MVHLPSETEGRMHHRQRFAELRTTMQEEREKEVVSEREPSPGVACGCSILYQIIRRIPSYFISRGGPFAGGRQCCGWAFPGGFA